jgi:serine/threonine-protein kinase HipA
MMKLKVSVNREKIGDISLLDNQGQMSFTYDEAWVKSGMLDISPHLKHPGPFAPQSLRNFLSNLLPEGIWLEDLSKETGCSKWDVFGLLAANGKETAGALSFSVEEEQSPPPTTFREIPHEELGERVAARGEISIAVWDQKPRLSVAGVQGKLPVLIRPDGGMGFGEGDLASTHILKFGRESDMHLVVNEFFCMRLASAVKLPVAEVSLERFGEPVLSVRRFDRQWKDGWVERLHVIDGCQMLDLPPTYKYERPFGNGEHVAGLREGASLPRLFDACRKYCNIPAAAINGFLHWALFQVLIGNSDAHGKNISFFVGRDGISLAPAYDLVCLDLYQYDRELSMAIGDCFEVDEVACFAIAEMCDICRLPRRHTAKSLVTLCDQTLRALSNLELPELTSEEDAFVGRLKASIAKRVERILETARDIPTVKL